MYDFYVDESSQNSHHFMVLGGAVVKTARAGQIAEDLRAVKRKHNVQSKIRWTDLTRHKVPVYAEFFDVFNGFIQRRQACFHSLIVDCHQIDNARYNDGDRELGFSKFMYQLLLHKFAKLHEPPPLRAYLDPRTTNQSLDEVRDMINTVLARDHNIKTRPLRVLQFQSPLAQPLLEAADLIIGATAYHKNGRHLAQGAAAHKCVLAQHVAKSLGRKLLGSGTPFYARTYTEWNFRFNPKRGSQGPR